MNKLDCIISQCFKLKPPCCIFGTRVRTLRMWGGALQSPAYSPSQLANQLSITTRLLPLRIKLFLNAEIIARHQGRNSEHKQRSRAETNNLERIFPSGSWSWSSSSESLTLVRLSHFHAAAPSQKERKNERWWMFIKSIHFHLRN